MVAAGVRRFFFMLWAAPARLPRAIADAYRVCGRAVPATAPRVGLSVASPRTLQRVACAAALLRAGGRPVLFTPTHARDRIARMLDGVSALLLSGGDDIDPRLYGGDPRSAERPNRRRDDFELQLLQDAVARDMPVLGICRGSQVLNVAQGGSVRDLRCDHSLAAYHGLGMKSFDGHDVHVRTASKLATGMSGGVQRVNSFHGQAVERLGAALQVSAAAKDGVIEGIEHTGRAFVVGVQWHPEIAALTDLAALGLFRELVRRAEAYRGPETAADARCAASFVTPVAVPPVTG
jgi:putative glutamine amidotransferase